MIKYYSLKPIFQLLFAGLLVSSFSGCKATKKLTQFNLDYETRVTIPKSTGINLPFNLFTPEVETNTESQFEVNDTRKDLVDEIRLTALSLTVESPQGEDFSFLNGVSIYLNADGLDEIKVAWKDPVPDGTGNKIQLDVSGDDLQEYIKKDKFTLRLNSKTDEVLTQDYQILVKSVFFVQAKLIGK